MFKKIFYLFIVGLLLVRSFSFNAYVVHADDLTPTVTEEISPTSDNSSTITPTSSITPTDSVTPSPTADPSITPAGSNDSSTQSAVIDTTNENNNAEVNNNLNSNSNSGNNSVNNNGSDPTITPTPTTVSTSSASLNTGDAISVSTTDNSVNTNYSNATVVTQTINLFFDYNGDIDLSLPEKIAAYIINSGNNNQVINAVITSNNTAVLINNVNSSADTGNNNVNSTGDANAQTGDAVSEVSLVNKVNFTVVNSAIHFVTINIFGNLNGNIILPDPINPNPCDNCSVSLNTSNNNAYLANNASGSANSGNNTVNASGSANLATGNASSVIDANNIVNSNILNSSFGGLFINDFGVWSGNFLGWGNLSGISGGQNIFVFIPTGNSNANSGSVDAQTVNNDSYVQNNINSSANSGNNSVNGVNSNLKTGNAYSVVCLQNFINSTIVNGFGFFGCINIFGKLNGNIGGQSYFPTPTPTPSDNNGGGSSNSSTSCSGTTSLKVDSYNNVGKYVNPGDTVTFFVNVTNTGSSPAHNLSMNLDLSLNGENKGGATYNLPDITPGQTLHITTGLVLSSNAPAGFYTGNASINGNNCDGSNVSGFGYSTFTINGVNSINSGSSTSNLFGGKNVLGKNIQISSPTCGSCIWWPFLLLETGALLIYNAFRVRRKKNNILFALIPVLTYILFILLNKNCLGLRFGLFPTSGSIYCRYFYLLDAGIMGGYLLLLVEVRNAIARRINKIKANNPTKASINAAI